MEGPSVFFSHASNTTAGVAVSLSEQFQSQQTYVIELVPGRTQRNDVHFSFFNIYTPNVGEEHRVALRIR